MSLRVAVAKPFCSVSLSARTGPSGKRRVSTSQILRPPLADSESSMPVPTGTAKDENAGAPLDRLGMAEELLVGIARHTPS